MKPAIRCRRFPVKRLLFLYFPLLLLTIQVLGQQSDLSKSRVLRLNEVNTYAARHLLKNFAPTAEVTWIQEKHGFVALCNEGDSVVKVYYKLNGNFESCTKYYLADDLNVNLKSTLLKKFPGCKIMMVTEVTNLEKEELFIKIKDGAYIRTVHFSGDGMEITENFLDGSS
jgi:hypothetical protein